MAGFPCFGFALGLFERYGKHYRLFVVLGNSSNIRLIYANVDRSAPNRKMMKYLFFSYRVSKIPPPLNRPEAPEQNPHFRNSSALGKKCKVGM